MLTFHCSTDWPDYMYSGMRMYPDPYGPLAGFIFFAVLQVFGMETFPSSSIDLMRLLSSEGTGAGRANFIELVLGCGSAYV